MSKPKQILRVCLDLSLFFLLCFAEFAIKYWFEPARRGFFCDDETLKYPYRPASVSLTTVIIVVLTVPTLVILAVELFRRLSSCDEATAVKGQGKVRRRLLACYKQIGCYLFGLALVMVATDVTKYSVGRLRPHFFTVCQPELKDGSTCDDAKNQNVYIEEYTCLGVNSTASMLSQVSQSFPSGHSSLFFYSMLYVAIYLQATLTTSISKLLKHVLQFVFAIFALFVALSRIAEYWHHWSDVFSGAVLGTFLATIVCVYVANLFDKPERNSSELKTTSLRIAKPGTTTTLPGYTFGSMPYLATQYGQPYHNYGYVA